MADAVHSGSDIWYVGSFWCRFDSVECGGAMLLWGWVNVTRLWMKCCVVLWKLGGSKGGLCVLF